MDKGRNVVVAGWGQVTQPKTCQSKIKDPMGLMIQASRIAVSAASEKEVFNQPDAVFVVRTLSRHYDAPAEQLARHLGAVPKIARTSGIGGNSPQTLVNIAAGMIARKEVDSVLIAGAECYVKREKISSSVEHALFSGLPDAYDNDDLVGATEIEIKHGMAQPLHGFPLYETALWAASGLDLDLYLKKVAKMWAAFSRVAQDHPLAWSRHARSAEQILTPGPDNRPVAFPYTKFMNSFVTVDMGAAIVLMAEETVKRPRGNGQPVYFIGGGYARDRQRFMIDKSDFTASVPLKDAVEKALERSTLSLDEIDCFDLYSCFPSAVSIAKKMIGIKDMDPRPLTLTGGLGFFGGPGNNYSLHSIVTLAQRIFEGKVNNGLITALGWFMHKHAAGIYANKPLSRIWDEDIEDQQNSPVGDPPEPVQEKVNGSGVIETYTIIYNRDGSIGYGLIYGKTTEGIRFVARTDKDAKIIQDLMDSNRVGDTICVHHNRRTGMNFATWE